jgi:hypothetical protein
MSAEIIQFGRPQSTSGRRKRPPKSVVADETPARASFEPTEEPDEGDGVGVRCVVDGELYEVEFHGANVWSGSLVHNRNSGGRIEVIRRRIWSAHRQFCRRDLDPAVVEAARRARGRTVAETLRFNREASIKQLRDRYARLMRDAEKVEATIAILQGGMN